ncbi:MAG: phage tail protein [Candidatus Tectimicrobiota bacterium]
MPEPCPVSDVEFTSLPLVLAERLDDTLSHAVTLVDGGVRLQGRPGYREERRWTPAGWQPIVDLALDGCDQVHLLDTAGRLWVYDLALQWGEVWRCLPALLGANALAVSAVDVFVAEGAQRRVRALARSNGQIRWLWEDATAEPGDLAVWEDRLYVLDRRGPGVIVLGPGGTVVQRFGAEVLDAPQCLAVGRDGGLYVLDQQQVVRFDRQGAHRSPDVPVPASVTTLAVDADGVLYLGDSAAALLWQCFPGDLQLQPLFGYTGPVRHIAVDRQGHLLLLSDEGRLVRLTRVLTYPLSGTVVFTPLDAGGAQTRWHKVLMQAEVPPGTRVALRYHITDDAQAAPVWSEPLLNPSDALLEGSGRFLRLQGELSTNDPLVTPGLLALTAVVPRQSSLRALPALYQEEPFSRAFLERFLALFDTLSGRLDSSIAATPCLLDAAAAPAAFLPWLASWLAFSLDEGWSTAQQRQFLAEAMSLYQQRGTRQGIARVVELVTGSAPIIIEALQLAAIEDPALQAEYRQLYGTEACHFYVLLAPQSAQHPGAVAMLRRVIEEQTPAHVQAGVLVLRPWYHLGMHTYLEINTALTQPLLCLEASVLGGGEIALLDREEAGQIERKSRIGLDSTLT